MAKVYNQKQQEVTMTQTTIGLNDLIPTLRRDTELHISSLPAYLNWSDSPGFYMDGQTAQFILDGTTYYAQPDVEIGVRMFQMSMNHREVPVTWTITVDIQTGEVWARPIFTQYKVNKGSPDGDPVDLQVFCRHLGLNRPQMVTILGRLVRLGNPGILPAQQAILRNIGVDPSHLGLWYPHRDFEIIRHALRRAFNL